MYLLPFSHALFEHDKPPQPKTLCPWGKGGSNPRPGSIGPLSQKPAESQTEPVPCGGSRPPRLPLLHPLPDTSRTASGVSQPPLPLREAICQRDPASPNWDLPTSRGWHTAAGPRLRRSETASACVCVCVRLSGAAGDAPGTAERSCPPLRQGAAGTRGVVRDPAQEMLASTA